MTPSAFRPPPSDIAFIVVKYLYNILANSNTFLIFRFPVLLSHSTDLLLVHDMPSKVRDRDRDRDRDQDAPKSRDKQRHRTSRRRSSTKDPEKPVANPERRSSHASPSVKRTNSTSIPELDRTASAGSPFGSKTSLPYPSFSKAHSKEAVGSREDVVNPRYSYYTPDPTDLDRSKEQSSEVENQNAAAVAPPSPPLTTVEQAIMEDQVTASPLSDEAEDQKIGEEKIKNPILEAKQETKKTIKSNKEDPTITVERKRTDLQRAADDLKRRLQRGKSSMLSEEQSSRPSSRSKSKKSQEEFASEAKSSASSRKPKSGTPSKSIPQLVAVEDTASLSTPRKPSSEITSPIMESETPTESIIDSDATSVAPNQPNVQQPSVSTADGQLSSITTESLTRAPAILETSFLPSGKQTPGFVINGDEGTPGPFDNSPAPPPPPPPPEMPYQVPRVDYLMYNGGLTQNVSKALLCAGQPLQMTQADPQLNMPVSAQVERFFAPFNNLLDDYSKVISQNGSLAVATGYRSIARRLLDRLEVVFARDISSEVCTCIICEASPLRDESFESEKGVSWGGILEFVCGRQERPSWPPFVLDPAESGLGISTIGQQAPMQNLDIDVPEEFRDHYIRQSKKTKLSVDKWLANQVESPTSPPQDVDDETLTFAMLTRLEPEQRPIFSTLVGIAPTRPPSRTATPLMVPRSSLLENTGLAIQRLYSLSAPPRDPESAVYLLSNPSMHNVLATLAAISDGEWEILTSGRFDGFLRSGAEDHSTSLPPPTQPLSRGPSAASRTAPSTPFSRGTTPFSRGPTPSPASVGAPVALDEETEIAVLAEVEREIYLGMEALEDAFEALHCKAETVRSALRERGAGLSMASERRRGARDLDARMGTPASANLYGSETETDDGFDDGASELAPDDSASNVSRSRHRRPKRRTERRTPAPVEEEYEGSE